MTSRDKYIETLKSKLDQWNAQISKAEAEMKAATHDARARYAEQIAQMKMQRANAEAKIEEAMRKSQDDWEKMRKEFEGAWRDIADGFSRAWSRLS